MFADIFNDLLDERGLNRKQFAEQSGIPYTTVIGWTNLNRLPDYTALIRIADFFQCPIDHLAGRKTANQYSDIAELSKEEQIILRHFRKLSPELKELVSNVAAAFAVHNKQT